MKILCIADKRDPIVYSNSIKERFRDVDLVLSAGDLDLEYYGFIVSSTNKPLLFVFGNHNLSKISLFKRRYADHISGELDDPYRPSFGSTFIGGKVTKTKGLLVAGLGGSRRYNGGINQHTEFGMLYQIFKMAPRLLWNKIIYGKYIDILLTHAAPQGIGDEEDPCHMGFKAFLLFMKWFKPTYLIHGHIHLYGLNERREYQYLHTKVINAYNHVVVEIDSTTLKEKGRKRDHIRKFH